MKLFTFLLLFSHSVFSFAQEKTSPIADVVIERNVTVLDLEGKTYENVTVRFKSVSPSNSIWGIYRVSVKIKNSEGETIWKKAFNNAYLYVFSDGQVQVGKPNFNMIVIFENDDGSYSGTIREKEGVY